MPAQRRSTSRIDNAEPIAFRIRQDDVVGIERPFVPMHLRRPERNQALDLASLVVGVQVKMDPRRDLESGALSIE